MPELDPSDLDRLFSRATDDFARAGAVQAPGADAAIHRAGRRRRASVVAGSTAVVAAVAVVSVVAGSALQRDAPPPTFLEQSVAPTPTPTATASVTRTPAQATATPSGPIVGPGPARTPDTGTTSEPPAAPLGLSGVTTVDPAVLRLPAGVRVEGEAVAAVRWTDRDGNGLAVLTSSTSQVHDPEADLDAKTARLFAYSIHEGPGQARVVRTVQDGVQDCLFDVTAGFVAPVVNTYDGALSDALIDPSDEGPGGMTQGPLTVTDLDGDGTAEVAFGYATGCRSDTSPVPLKELVLEGDRKYIIRGQSFLSPQATREDGRAVDLTGAPEPAPDSWPAGVYDRAAARYAHDALLGALPG